MTVKATRLDYGQFLLSSRINYTLTYLADHIAGIYRGSNRQLRTLR